MLDQVDAEREHEYSAHFHMAPGIDTTLHHETGRLEARTASANLDIVYPEGQGLWSVADGPVSPCYGAKVTAPHGTYSTRAAGPAALLAVLFPRSAGQLPPEIRRLHVGRGKGLVVATSRFRDLMLWSAEGVAAEGLHATDFEWVWMRHSDRDRLLEQAVFMHGSRISSDEFDVTAERRVEFAAVSVQHRTLSIDVFPPVGIRIRAPGIIDRVVVNGGLHLARTGVIVHVMEHEVPTLDMQRDLTDLCSHVRY
jgi:hypothetical protein